MIDDASGRTHHHVHAPPQGVELWLIALSAVDRQDVKSLEMRGIALESLGNLEREFPGRHQHQHLGVVRRQIDARQGGQRERRRFPGTGLRLTEHVSARQQHRNGGGLDRRGRLIADVGERPQHRFR